MLIDEGKEVSAIKKLKLNNKEAEAYNNTINQFVTEFYNLCRDNNKADHTLSDDIKNWRNKYNSSFTKFMSEEKKKSKLFELLYTCSPKFVICIFNIFKSKGPVLVYSNYVLMEGLQIFKIYLGFFGFIDYHKNKDDEKYDGFRYVEFHGSISTEIRRENKNIFNDKENYLGKNVKIIMLSPAGAEGITLRNVRNVHIVESQWNPGDLEQAIGRANRICSHASLPMDERTFKVHIYITVFSEKQTTDIEGPNIVLIRRNDMTLKRYDSEQPVDTFMSTDEYMYEKAYEKGRLNKNITLLLKQSAVDCEIHRKLHSKNGEVLQCMRFDTTTKAEDLAYKPNASSDEKDAFYLRNIIRRKRRLQKVRVKGFELILDPDSKEVFDAQAYEDNKRLLKLGTYTPSEINWFRL
jgi:hypothetical protein